MSVYKIINGDAIKSFEEMPDESVQLVITSPPYWNIKDYGVEGQIGYNESYAEYLSSLLEVWRNCIRVLSPGCQMCINIGEIYVAAGEKPPYHFKPIHSEITQDMLAENMLYLGTIIWKKVSNTTTSGGCSLMGSMYYPRDGGISYSHEYIMIFKKYGKSPKPTPENKELSKLTKEERFSYFRGIWDIPGEKQKGHCAMFPLEIPLRLIKMYSFAGETVLDPFLGSGTTMLAAKQLGRSCIGIELNPSFIPLIETKTGVKYDRQSSN